MNSTIVVTSLVKSHVVFKLLNYVTDKILRVVLTLAFMLTFVQTVCEGERAGEIEYVLSVHNKMFCFSLIFLHIYFIIKEKHKHLKEQYKYQSVTELNEKRKKKYK